MTQDASLGRLPPIHSTSSILAPVPASCVVFIDIVIVIVVAVVIVIVVNISLLYTQPAVSYLFYYSCFPFFSFTKKRTKDK